MKAPTTVVVYLSASCLALAVASTQGQQQFHSNGPTEALAGFDNLTNGFVTQAQFDIARATFEERESIAEGLGPMSNANPVPVSSEPRHRRDQPDHGVARRTLRRSVGHIHRSSWRVADSQPGDQRRAHGAADARQ